MSPYTFYFLPTTHEMIDLVHLFFIVLHHSFVLIFSYKCIVFPKGDKLLVEGDCFLLRWVIHAC